MLDQARLVEGQVQDPVALVQRLQTLSALAAQALGVGATVETAVETEHPTPDVEVVTPDEIITND